MEIDQHVDDGKLHRCEQLDDDDEQCYKAGKWREFCCMYLCEECDYNWIN